MPLSAPRRLVVAAALAFALAATAALAVPRLAPRAEAATTVTGCRSATAILPYYSLPNQNGKYAELQNEIYWCYDNGNVVTKTNYGPVMYLSDYAERLGITYQDVKLDSQGIEGGPCLGGRAQCTAARYRSKVSGRLTQQKSGFGGTQENIGVLQLTTVVTGDGGAYCAPSASCRIVYR